MGKKKCKGQQNSKHFKGDPGSEKMISLIRSPGNLGWVCFPIMGKYLDHYLLPSLVSAEVAL